MQIPIYQVDAFTDRVFAGNPAAVCPLESWLPDGTLQAIAAENNLAETAFFVPAEGGYELRWFTPTVEIDLCGHATLATACVIMTLLDPGRERVSFQTRRAGKLTVAREGDRFTLDFPARPPVASEGHPDLVPALGGAAPEALFEAAGKYLVVYTDEETVRGIRPDFRRLPGPRGFGVIVTAPGREVDFVSRYFAPAHGIDEDPVTGAAHCTLTPYWAGRLGRTVLEARQVSARGGALTCALDGDRVRMTGAAVLYLQGTIHV
jgi:PhzF family phenazine biosynthesis protein